MKYLITFLVLYSTQSSSQSSFSSSPSTSLSSSLTSFQSSNSSEFFQKVPNSFSLLSNWNWTLSLCLLAHRETRKFPDPACLGYSESYPELKPNPIENRRKILVTGTARSGTTMLAAISSVLGVELSNDAHPPTGNCLMVIRRTSIIRANVFD